VDSLKRDATVRELSVKIPGFASYQARLPCNQYRRSSCWQLRL